LDRQNNPRIAAQRPPEKQLDCATVGVCAEGIKKDLNTLDEADFVRDVDKSAYHHLSQNATIYRIASPVTDSPF